VTFGDTDHLLFPGLVWSPHFQALFRRLSAEGRKFTVLIHDLIQIQRPDLVGEAASTEFAAWLAVVLRTATSILVPSVVTREAILAWARDGGFGTLPPIVALRFGMSHLASAPTEPPGRGVRVGNYVLSVGTIDRRKNQHMLIDAWNELIAGPQAVPQLVLAGRLMAQDDLVIVQDATDAELAALYANCRFTLFPSLAEGFGLPVAESLRFGKVCVASALPEIREFAGDFVWYFPPGSLDGALGQIRRAIGSPDDLAAQERAIATGFVAPSWSDAIRQIRDVIGR
jgi:glycosyltransferase involved in cell wall biosynthesis